MSSSNLTESPRRSRRALLRGLLGAAAAGLTSCRGSSPGTTAACAGFRHDRIRWIVGSSPGGGFDTVSRMIAPYYGRRIGAGVIVANISGGVGVAAARTIRDARPDGSVLGLVDVNGLLIAALSATNFPDPRTDFTIIGRLTREPRAWIVAADSPLASLDAVVETSARRPIVFGVTDPVSGSFVSASLGAHALDLPTNFIAGYGGTRESILALMRHEFDVLSTTFETALPGIEAGQLRLILWMGQGPVPDRPAFAGTYALGGPDGYAARRAARLGRSPEDAAALADGLTDLFDLGRAVVGPPGMDAATAACMESALVDLMDDPDLQREAQTVGRRIDVGPSAEMRTALASAAATAEQLAVVLRRNIDRLR